MREPEAEFYLTLNQVCKVLGVEECMVLDWVMDNKLQIIEADAGHEYFLSSEIERLAKGFGYELNLMESLWGKSL